MKTKIVLKTIIFLFAILLSNRSNAQCTYTIVNALGTGCDATVDIYIWVSPNCPGTPGNACQIVTGLLVPAGQQVSIPCGGCGTPCEIFVYVTDIGGTTVSVAPASFFSGAITLGPCASTDINFYSPFIFKIQ